MIALDILAGLLLVGLGFILRPLIIKDADNAIATVLKCIQEAKSLSAEAKTALLNELKTI